MRKYLTILSVAFFAAVLGGLLSTAPVHAVSAETTETPSVSPQVSEVQAEPLQATAPNPEARGQVDWCKIVPKHCQPKPAELTVNVDPCCVPAGQQTGSATVTLHNPNQKKVVYVVTLSGGHVRLVAVDGGETKSVTFHNLPARDYEVTVVGSDGTFVRDCFTIEECQVPPVQVAPTIEVTAGPCVSDGLTNGVITVKVTNPNAADVVYDVSIAGQTKQLLVAANSTASVDMTGLGAGNNYLVEVYGNNGTSATTEVTLEACPKQPCPCQHDCGGMGGGPVVPPVVTPPAIPEDPVVPQVSASPLAMPAALPATGSAPVNFAVILLPALLGYAVVFYGRRLVAVRSKA